MAGILTRGLGGKHRHTREEGCVVTEAETAVKWLQSKECQGLTATARTQAEARKVLP